MKLPAIQVFVKSHQPSERRQLEGGGLYPLKRQTIAEAAGRDNGKRTAGELPPDVITGLLQGESTSKQTPRDRVVAGNVFPEFATPESDP